MRLRASHAVTKKRPTIDVLTLKDTDGERYVDLQLRPAELEAIGRVATSWSFLELMILTQSRGLAIALGLNAPPEDVEQTPFRTRRQAWVELARRHCTPEQWTRFEPLAETASSLANRRNHVIHDIMSIHPDDKNLLRALPTKEGGQFGKLLDVAQIKRLDREIARLSHSLLVFFGDPYTLPDASRRRRDRPNQNDPTPVSSSRGRHPTRAR